MTPKEKAIEITSRFAQSGCMDDYAGQHECSIECALIAVDEILSFIEDDRIGFNWKEYYEQVKQEMI
jgi:hypothetical protein